MSVSSFHSLTGSYQPSLNISIDKAVYLIPLPQLLNPNVVSLPNVLILTLRAPDVSASWHLIYLIFFLIVYLLHTIF